jgi:transposase
MFVSERAGMDRQQLAAWVAEGLSLERIGRLVGRHPSTVAYWLKQHGLDAANRTKHAARGPIDRVELTALVARGASIAEIAEQTSRSKATVRHWLARYELRTKNGPGRRRRPETRAAREAGIRELDMTCPHHGPTVHRVDIRGYYRCVRCGVEAVARRRREVKSILVAEFGGSCALCGYDRDLAALQFHHVDSSTKQFAIAQKGVARSLDKLRAEAAKCVLLCSNCHAEVEHGSVSLSSEPSPPG